MLDFIKNNKDVVCTETDANCTICYQEQLCNILEFMKDFFSVIDSNKSEKLSTLFPGICQEIEYDERLIEQLVFSGLLVAYRNKAYYSFDLSKTPSRQTSDSIVEAEGTFQSRDGFVENFKDNIALIRTRVKDSRLQIKSITIGRRSKTIVSLLSINDIHNDIILKKIINRLESIDVDAITSMDDIAVYFSKKGLFPSYQYVGSPDLAARRLYNGEFLIIVDRLSIVLVIPVNISITSRMAIDNLNIPIFTFLERLFIVLSLLISTVFLGLFASVTSFQSDSLSYAWLSILKVIQKGVVFPIIFEILIVIGLFELIYLIGFRQSKITLSSTVVLIGGLIIGENLVTSGVSSVFVITFVAIAFLMTFFVSNNSTVLMSISTIRLIILLASFYLGLFGIVLASIIIVYLMYNQKCFGVHYFYPFIPLDLSGIKRFFMSNSSIKNKVRDEELKIKNKYRKDIK